MNQANQSKLTEEQEAEIVRETAKMKRTFKTLSKNQLIMLLLQQINFAVEQQNVNRVLLERMKELEPKLEPKPEEEIKNV